MENILLKDVLVLEKEGYSKSDKGEYCMASLWTGTQPLKYVRTNLPKNIYDKIKSGEKYNMIVDYRFFQDKCTGLKVTDLM